MDKSTDDTLNDTLNSELDQAHDALQTEGAESVITDTPLAHSGYVAVIGRPNVGKSTLMNRILGEKIAIVSPKPQTTRLRQLGIYTTDEAQIIFVDTPGIHQPRHKLGEFMVEVALEALRDADVIVFVVEVAEAPVDEDKRVAELIKEAGTRTPVILALNKIDQAAAEHVMPNVEAYRALVPDADWTTISAKKGDGVDDLVKRLISKLPSGPQFYPEDQLSDTAMRLVSERSELQAAPEGTIRGLVTTIEPTLRRKMVEADVARVRQLLGFLEVWWKTIRAAVSRTPLTETDEFRGFLKVVQDESALARLGHELALAQGISAEAGIADAFGALEIFRQKLHEDFKTLFESHHQGVWSFLSSNSAPIP